jgi:ATP-dependent protease ClpP protease subunit
MKNVLKKWSVCIAALAMFSTSAFAGGQSKIELTSTNSTALVGEVNADSVSQVVDFIMKSKEKEIVIYFDSPGGSVFDGLQLAEAIENSDKKITCVASMAASMAFYLLQSCDVRLITSSAILMQHVSSYGMRGNEPNNYSFAKFIRSISVAMDTAQAKRINMKYKKFKYLVRNDWWLFGERAIKANVADGTATVSCSAELTEKVVERSQQMLFWVVKVKYSACPLTTSPIETDAKRIGGTDQEANAELRAFSRSRNSREILMDYLKGDRSGSYQYSYFAK